MLLTWQQAHAIPPHRGAILIRPLSPSSSAVSRQGASPWALSAKKQKTLAEELDDLRLDESAMSEEEKKKLQGLRASYKLEEVLDFDGKTGEPLPAGASYTRKEDDPDYDPLDDAEDLSVAETAWSGQAGLDVLTQGNNNPTDLAARPFLALGDVAMLLLFASIGRSIHTGGISLDFQVLQTAAPFIGAWLLLAPLLGAFTPGATRSTGEAVKTVSLAWAVSVPMGLVGRGVIKGDIPPLPFMAVTMVTTWALLVVWRAAVVVVAGGEVKGGGGNKKSGVMDLFRMVTTLIGRW
ncbi:hypothetical protein VYU27_003977 [Nannochloropsis oceanica]